MFKNVVVAVDGSDQSRHAVQVACDLANHYGSKLHLVHAPEVETVGLAVGSGAFEVPPSQDEIVKAGKEVMGASVAAAKEMGITPTETISYGKPADEVLNTAKKTGADLIVAGRRGLGSLSSLVLGSTSQKIAHDAQCAVLTVK